MTETDIEKYVKSLEPKIFGLDVLDKIQVRELGGGLHHKNYRIHFGEPTSDAYSFVLRIPASQFDFKDLENELWYIRQLQSHGIPQFVHFSESGPNGYPALISKFASGHHIEFAKLSAQQIAEFAKTLASIHSLKNDHFSAGKAEQPARNGCYRDYAQFTLAERIEKPYDAVKNFVEHDTVMLASAKATLSELLKGAEPGGIALILDYAMAILVPRMLFGTTIPPLSLTGTMHAMVIPPTILPMSMQSMSSALTGKTAL